VTSEVIINQQQSGINLWPAYIQPNTNIWTCPNTFV